MKITKKHKLYFREKGLSIRRLDKASPGIYIYILRQFIEGDANEKYWKLNEKVNHWSDYRPIEMILPTELNDSFKTLVNLAGSQKTNTVTISYNGSWRPLVNLMILND